MKRITLLLFLFIPSSLLAQSYAINWFAIAGGGGTSTNAEYSISGTIGQSDAGGPLTGGNYSLTGGFWSFLAVPVQTPGAPTLKIVPAGPGQATISWAPTAGFVLQEATSLTPSNWTNSASGGTNPVTVPANSTLKLYRLVKP